jgi:hypothetical protein
MVEKKNENDGASKKNGLSIFLKYLLEPTFKRGG